MRIQYRNEFQDYLALHKLIGSTSYEKQKSAYYSSLWTPISIAVLGVIGSYQDNLFVTCLILSFLGIYLYSAFPYKKHYDSALELGARTTPEKDITLEFKDDGMHEQVDGIQSYCPWQSIKSFLIIDDTLFIELSSNLWAIIPERFLKDQNLSLKPLKDLLESKQIKQRS